MQIKTFHQWIRDGRVVKRGERASYSLVSPDGAQSASGFTLDQTDPYVDVAAGWTDVVARTDAKAAKDPRAKVRIDHQDDLVRIWCGSDAKAIGMCQKGGAEYEPKSHRWVAERSAEQFEGIVELFEAEGFNVVVGSAPSSTARLRVAPAPQADERVEPYAVFADGGYNNLKVFLRPDNPGMMRSLGFTTKDGVTWRAGEECREQLLVALEVAQYTVHTAPVVEAA